MRYLRNPTRTSPSPGSSANTNVFVLNVNRSSLTVTALEAPTNLTALANGQTKFDLDSDPPTETGGSATTHSHTGLSACDT